VAPELEVTTFPFPVGNDNDIESAIEELARDRDSGFIAMNDSFVSVHPNVCPSQIDHRAGGAPSDTDHLSYQGRRLDL
jgi:hypothetical protein